jgi:hypothetical protein
LNARLIQLTEHDVSIISDIQLWIRTTSLRLRLKFNGTAKYINSNFACWNKTSTYQYRCDANADFNFNPLKRMENRQRDPVSNGQTTGKEVEA